MSTSSSTPQEPQRMTGLDVRRLITRYRARQVAKDDSTGAAGYWGRGIQFVAVPIQDGSGDYAVTFGTCACDAPR